MSSLRDCQRQILRSHPHPHYGEAYSHDEIYYWFHIPRWLEQDHQGDRVLSCWDIGSAYGTLALFCRLYLGYAVWCTDMIDDYWSDQIARQHDLRFRLSNIELDSPPWEQQFEVILLTEVLEHFNFHPTCTLQKIRGQLTAGGRLYVSTPDGEVWGRRENRYASYQNMPQPNRSLPIHDGHIYLYTLEELSEMFSAAGFEFARVGYAPGVGARHLNLTLIAT